MGPLNACSLGANNSPAAICLCRSSIWRRVFLGKHGSQQSLWRSRTLVTPWAIISGPMTPNAVAESRLKWTCISQSPGTRYFPRASITTNPSGTTTDPVGPTCVMRPPASSTVWFTCRAEAAEPCDGSITVTHWSASPWGVAAWRLSAEPPMAEATENTAAIKAEVILRSGKVGLSSTGREVAPIDSEFHSNSLFSPQCLRRVHSRSASRRQVTGEKGHPQQ